jgi:transposase
LGWRDDLDDVIQNRMGHTQGHQDVDVNEIVEAILAGTCTEELAQRLYRLGPEAVTLALMAATRKIVSLRTQVDKGAATSHPSTPSGQIPVYAKPNAPRRRRCRRGAKNGHPGHHRDAPLEIHRRQEHRCSVCPQCGGPVQRCDRRRTRIIEDLPDDLHGEVTEHTMWRDYCPRCKKDVEPVVAEALPKATFGHRLVSFTAWLHYGLGVTIAHIVAIVGHHLHTDLSAGALIGQWHRLGEILSVWYEQIGQEARHSATLHADETGWRLSGRTHWLWCFANPQVCYYLIDRCRGSPVLKKFFSTVFEGVLITDFWAAYNAVEAAFRQCCHAHLLRELDKTDLKNDTEDWKVFAKVLRRLIRDAIRLRKRPDFSPQRYARRIERIETRLARLLDGDRPDADVRRLLKRLRRYQGNLFTFLHRMDVPYDNNFAERQIRPAVILRKNSQCNHSEKGAATQAVLMSVYQTLKLRGLNPLNTIVWALRTYTETGRLPSLPAGNTACG